MSGTAVMDGVTISIPPPAPAPLNSANQPPEQYFTAEQVAAFRKQEKDKLYSEIEAQKAKTDEVTKRMEAFLAEAETARQSAAEQQAAADELRRQQEEAELSAKDLLARKEDEWNSKFNSFKSESEHRIQAIQDERDRAAEVLAKEQRYQELTTYKSRAIAAAGEALAPLFHDTISGSTEDEIDASISLFVTKSSAIIEASQHSAPAPRVRGVSPIGAPPAGPLENQSGTREVSLAEIKAMDYNDYAKVREQLLAATSRSNPRA